MIKRVLIVDDEQISRFISSKMILQVCSDCQVDTATNGLLAISLLNELSMGDLFPKYIFLDLNMPVMDGFEFLQKFKASSVLHNINTSIVVLTSSVNEGDKQRALSSGANYFFSKPLTIELTRSVLVF